MTACPDFDRLCTTGVVATQTFLAAGATGGATNSASATDKPSATDGSSATGGVDGPGRASDGGDGDEDKEGAARASLALLDVWAVAAAGLGGIYMALR